MKIDPTFHPRIAGGSVNAISVAANGSVLIAGDFQTVNGTPRAHVGRLNADGSLDPSFAATAIDGVVNDLAPGNSGEIYIGGRFAGNLVRLLPNGGMDRSFEVQPSDGVDCLAIDESGRILFGGGFRNVAGQSFVYLGRAEGEKLDPSFHPSLRPSFAIEAGVSAVAVQPDGKIVVAGVFETDRGFESLIRLNQDGSLDASFSGNHGPILYPRTLRLLPDGQILIGGQAPDGSGFVRLLRADRSVIESFVAPRFDGVVNAAAIDSHHRVIVGGAFHQPGQGVIRLLSDGSVDKSWDIRLTGVVKTLKIDADANLWIAGDFGVLRLVDPAIGSLATNTNAFRGILRLNAAGSYVIETSTDLRHWTEFDAVAASGQTLSVVDQEVSAHSMRFFRARAVQ